MRELSPVIEPEDTAKPTSELAGTAMVLADEQLVDPPLVTVQLNVLPPATRNSKTVLAEGLVAAPVVLLMVSTEKVFAPFGQPAARRLWANASTVVPLALAKSSRNRGGVPVAPRCVNKLLAATPAGPVGPVGPAAPGEPGDPVLPVGPVGPVKPGFPCGPVAPMGPAFP